MKIWLYRSIFPGLVLFQAARFSGYAAEKVDFVQEIKPILESACLSCHGPEKPKGKLRLDTLAGALQGGEKAPAIVPGKPAESPLYTSTILPPGHDDIMPPKGDPLTKAQTELLRQWIEQGAPWPGGLTLQQVKRMDFVKDIQPLLEFNCVACHREGHVKGGLRLDTRAEAFKGGDNGPVIVPGKAKSSPLYTSTILSAEDDAVMPPKAKDGPLPKEKTDPLARWIEQGANWPEGIALVPRKPEEAPGENEPLVVTNIHKLILAKLEAKTEAEMKPFTNTIPGTEVSYVMLPIPSGQFVMGSPAAEAGRQTDEGPQHSVKISPFWMGQCEVTWDEFELFMYPDTERKFKNRLATDPYVDKISDAVSRPTKPYVEMSFGMGKGICPAISMTQHAANKYCQWLSAKTGQFYRLPTEAEWEYACRAGTTTRWSFGDDPTYLAPGTPPAVVRELIGTGEYQKGGAGAWSPVVVGQTLQPGDKFRTATNSRALVEFAYLGPSRVSEKITIAIPQPDWLGQHAWYEKNSDYKYQKVGTKKPNPWGLHDMHGNVAEWCLDQYESNYEKFTAAPMCVDPWLKASKPYPHVARGGSWDDAPAKLRSAARRGSDKSWKMQDPQLPKSIWYHTDAQFLGFRVIRPLVVPSPEELSKYWTSGVEKD